MSDTESGAPSAEGADAEPSPACPLCSHTDALLENWDGRDVTYLIRRYTCDCGARFSTAERITFSEPIWVPKDWEQRVIDPKKRQNLKPGRYWVRLDQVMVICYERLKGKVGYWEGHINTDPQESCRKHESVMIGPADDMDGDGSHSERFSFSQAVGSPRLIRMRELSDIRTHEKQKVTAAINARKARDAGLAAAPPK